MNNYKKIFFVFFSLLFLFSCDRNEGGGVLKPDYPDWTELTHGKDAEPNFDVVFDKTKVHRLEIQLSAADWAEMITDIEVNLLAQTPPTDYTPIWKAADIVYDNIKWYKVGIRFKGNSNLRSALIAGIKKFAFKLDFDQFEETYPDLADQRFYGFRQLNLNNCYEDNSCMRQVVADEMFAAMGVPVVHSAFYAVYFNNGTETVYLGMYSLMEDVDNTVIKTQFSDNNGNLYEPDGRGASFKIDSYATEYFEKQTNISEADWSDVEALYNAIHQSNRITNPQQWRADLERVFFVDGYLKYLAANTVIQNWDTYGRKKHNYYLYNNPENSKLTWIPSDNNEALKTGNEEEAILLDLSDVDEDWPLIRFLADDTYYYSVYKQYVTYFSTNFFNASIMQAKYTAYANLIRSYVVSETAPYTFLSAPADFETEISYLQQHVAARDNAVQVFLNQ